MPVVVFAKILVRESCDNILFASLVRRVCARVLLSVNAVSCVADPVWRLARPPSQSSGLYYAFYISHVLDQLTTSPILVTC